MLAQSDNELLTPVDPGIPMGTLFRRFWQPISLSSRITSPDGRPVWIRVLGENLIAFRNTHGDAGVLQPRGYAVSHTRGHATIAAGAR